MKEHLAICWDRASALKSLLDVAESWKETANQQTILLCFIFWEQTETIM